MSDDCGCNTNPTHKPGSYAWQHEKVTICSPGNTEAPIIPQSCLTKKALLQIVASWNEEKGTKKIKDAESMNANDLYRLVESHMRETFGCKTEDCWVESLTHPYGARESLLSLFQPRYPDSFKEKSNSWWSSSQIDSVVRPYTYSHPFYWCGVVPLDFKEQRRLQVCLSREICAVNLKELVERGCCLVAGIFNLDYSWQNGSHWVAAGVDLRRGDVWFFDSFGYPPLALIKEWMETCSFTLNQMVKNKSWTPCEAKCLHLKSSNIHWSSGKEIEIKCVISNRLKIDEGMYMISKQSGRCFLIETKEGRRKYTLQMSTRKEERAGDWTIMGARSYYLSRRAQKSTTECGSFSIHVVLEAVKGRDWYDIVRNLPSDKEMKELRKSVHRQVKNE